jgi:hypothetical protein
MCREARQARAAAAAAPLRLEVPLSDVDLDEIDALIADGIFDSREDAVEHFLRAGIGETPRVVDVPPLHASAEGAAQVPHAGADGRARE